jgi:WD40 repeat protein
MKNNGLRLFLLFASFTCVFSAIAQNQGNIWYFGIEAGLDLNASEPIPLLDGQTYAPAPNLWNEGTSTISDASGTLLMYSNGAMIWNNDHEVMLNGDSLLGHPSSTHAALIVPRPSSDRYFYVFTTDASENQFENGWRYSVVDMCAGDGKGGVLMEEKNVFLAGPVAEKLAAVRHANGVDHWVVSHRMGNNVFLVALLTASGLGPVVETAIGPNDEVGWGGQIVFSPDGTKLGYAVASLQGSMTILDFNTATGVLSNARTRANPFDNMVWGMAFSPDGSKLYTTTSNTGALRQYDLNAGPWQSILASEVTLGTIIPDYWKDLRLGPDDRIYVTHSGSSFLGRISAPNVPGVGCGFTDNAVSLGGRLCSFGLPNFVTDYAYESDKPQCTGGATGLEEVHRGPVVVMNGASGSFSIQPNGYQQAEVYDIKGRLFKTTRLNPGGGITLIDLSTATAGYYFYRLLGNEGVTTGRILVGRP